jgi:hypothetical protein
MKDTTNVDICFMDYLNPLKEGKHSKSADEQFPQSWLLDLSGIHIRHKRRLKKRVSDVIDSIFDEDELQSESDSMLSIPAMLFTSDDYSAAKLYELQSFSEKCKFLYMLPIFINDFL